MSLVRRRSAARRFAAPGVAFCFAAVGLVSPAPAQSQAPTPAPTQPAPGAQPAPPVELLPADTAPADPRPARPRPVQPDAVEPAPADDLLTDKELVEQRWLLNMLQDPTQNAVNRRQAAIMLFEHDRTELNHILLGLLDQDADPGVKRYVAQGVVGSAIIPPPTFAPALLKMLPTAQPPLLNDVAAALGRFTSDPVHDAVIAMALDEAKPESVRRNAITALVYFRTQAAAGALMQLIDEQQPHPVQDAAFAALAKLTGLTDYNLADKRDKKAQRWRLWWRDHQQLTRDEWYASLINNFAQRHQQLADLKREVEQQLVNKQRLLFRATPPEGRPDVLRSMLTDPIEGIRQEALELTLQMRVDGGQVSPELRAAVRAVLNDTSPALRASACRLLRELGDEDAAAAIARILASKTEQEPIVLKEYLAMMAKMPQPVAVDAVLELLLDERVRPEAASALAAAADRGMVEKIVTERAAANIRQQLRDDRPPDPAIIRLLARIGNGEDWQRIASWLSHSDAAVREAAVRAWADSPDQPLPALTPYMNDPLVRSQMIAAATRRGKEPATLDALISHRPDPQTAGPQLRQAWQQALLAMSTRLPPETVLAANAKLAELGEPADFRGQFLTGAIERLTARRAVSDAGPTPAFANDGLLYDLLVARARARLAGTSPTTAAADYERVETLELRVNPMLRRQAQLALIEAHLQTGEPDKALATAEKALGRPQVRDQKLFETIVDSFLSAAERKASAGQAADAQAVLQRLLKLAGPDPSVTITRRVEALQAQITAAGAALAPTP